MLQRPLSKLFGRLGNLIYDHCVFFIVIPLVLVCCLSAGLVILIFKTPEQHPSIFSPDNGPAYREREKIVQYWPFNESDYYPLKNFEPTLLTDVMIAAKGEGNFLKAEYRNYLKDILEEISELSVADESGVNYKYADLCLKYKGKCYGNSQVELLKQHSPRSSLYNLNGYPFAIADERKEYVGNIYGGVSFANDTGYIKDLKAVRLIFFVKQTPEKLYSLGHRWLRVVENFLHKRTIESNDFEYGLFSKMTVADVTSDTATRISRRIPSAVILVFIYSFFATLSFFKVDKDVAKGLPIIVDWSSSKVLFGFLGVVVSGMGIASGLGLIVLTHMLDFSAILVVVPFLILGIGMDDTFIMLSSWSKNSHQPTVRERISETMADSAVSITITTLTNVLSFGIGASSPFPAIRIFCVNTGFALIFAFFYQITFFAACLVLGGQREAKHQHCVACVHVMNPLVARSKGVAPYLLLSGTTDVTPVDDQKPRKYRSIRFLKGFMTRYGKVLLSKVGMTVAIILFVGYIIVAGYGFYHMRVGLDPPRLVPEFHPAKIWYSINERYFWEHGERVDVFITKPPKLYVPKERERFLKFVDSLEDTRYIMSSKYTSLWVRDYLEHLATKQGKQGAFSDPDILNKKETWTSLLCFWLATSQKIPEHPPIVWKDGIGTSCSEMSAFRFTVGMKNFIGAQGQSRATREIRELVAAKPEYDAVSYNFLWQFMDQYTVVEPCTMKAALIALATMIVIAVLFLPSLHCALLVGCSIVTVTLGVVGGYHYWDVSLDFVSMVNIILSIGFAVDLTAHIAHAFTTDEGPPIDRAIRALRDIGTPVIQGALSTFIAMFTLSLSTDDYVTLVFFKTMFLVVLSGFLHAVVFLPVLMTLCSLLKDRLCSRVSTVKPEINLKL